jgi:deazaflavin-dependent oxidoreductase (nitroreductase family)
MTTSGSFTEERLRQGFKKYLNPFMLTMWRLGLGGWFKVWPAVSGNVMVLTHIGRKTGIKRYQPLNYAIVDDDIYCVAAFGSVSDWYRNIKANHNVEVWLPNGWWAGVAEEVSDSPARIQLVRQVLIGSGFAAYVAGVNPLKMTDTDIETESNNYRLIRIRRNVARTGSGGPGDLAWVWQLVAIILLGLMLLRRKR